MMVEIEVLPNKNIADQENRTFMGRGVPFDIRKTIHYNDDGSAVEVDLVGWHDDQPVPARALHVEDSGDGDAWLIYGGNQGLRLRQSLLGRGSDGFSYQNPDEWGELYLYYSRDLYEQAIKPFIKLE